MFEVFYTAESEAEIAAAYRAVSRRVPGTARRWIGRMLAAIDGLAEMPERYSVVEDDSDDLGYEVREMIFGKRRRAYRIRYRIIQDLVVILTVERASRNR